MKHIWLTVLCAACIHAQPVAFTVSQVSLAASNAADAAATLYVGNRGVESNPLGVNGVLVAKAVFVPLMIKLERRAVRRNPHAAKWFTLLNFGISGEMGYAAQHNARLVQR